MIYRIEYLPKRYYICNMAKVKKEEQDDKPVKTSLSIRPSKMRKLKILAGYAGKNITELVDEGIDSVIKSLETQHGKIKG